MNLVTKLKWASLIKIMIWNVCRNLDFVPKLFEPNAAGFVLMGFNNLI